MTPVVRMPITVLPQTMVQAMEARAELVKTMVDGEIVKEVITGIPAMKTTTGEISSLVENQQ